MGRGEAVLFSVRGLLAFTCVVAAVEPERKEFGFIHSYWANLRAKPLGQWMRSVVGCLRWSAELAVF